MNRVLSMFLLACLLIGCAATREHQVSNDRTMEHAVLNRQRMDVSTAEKITSVYRYFTDSSLLQVTQIRERASTGHSETVAEEQSKETRRKDQLRKTERPFWRWGWVAMLLICCVGLLLRMSYGNRKAGR